MLYLEDRFQKAVPFVAAEHDDHSPHRHTHILAVLPGRLSPQDLAALRGVATEAALFQRQERDLAQTRPIQGQLAVRSQRQAPRAEPRHSRGPGRGAGRAGSRLVRGQLEIAGICPRCGAPLGSRQRVCASCGLRLPRRGEGGRVGTVAATLSQLLYGLLVALNRLSAALSPSRKHLHHARFAHLHELASLQAGNAPGDPETSLLLGVGELGRMLRVRPTRTRRELGNLLVVAPTRGGKGLLATSQLLTWQGSVVVNDIKGELFAQTAGYRSTLGPVYVIDPTGVGHRYDPLLGKKTEDELLSSATHLLFKPDEGEGAIFTQRATVMLTQLFLASTGGGSSAAALCPPDHPHRPYRLR